MLLSIVLSLLISPSHASPKLSIQDANKQITKALRDLETKNPNEYELDAYEFCDNKQLVREYKLKHACDVSGVLK